jgi:hypothetical protein
LDILPFLLLERRLGGEGLRFACVELLVGLMTFLRESEDDLSRDGSLKKWEGLTKSSWTSLNAETKSTTARGPIVVYLLVGDTSGIC